MTRARLIILLGLMAPSAMSLGVALGQLPWPPLAWTLALSAAASLALADDKRRARRRAWRAPERRLHMLALLGGWPGALVGQQWLRHKTQKASFQRVTWLITAAHLMAWTAWVIWKTLSA